MFDDPKKELHRLEQQLKAVEPIEEPEDTLCEEESEDAFDPGINPALDFQRTMYADEEDVFAVPSGKRNKARKKEKQKQHKKRKKNNSFFMLLVMILELILIVVLLRWWLQWLT